LWVGQRTCPLAFAFSTNYTLRRDERYIPNSVFSYDALFLYAKMMMEPKAHAVVLKSEKSYEEDRAFQNTRRIQMVRRNYDRV
jgi:hypothetical protein